MQIVIVAGGLGTRLQALGFKGPKALAPVCGKPFLQYQLNWLAYHDLRDVVLCVGYLADQIEAFAQDGTAFGVRITYSREEGRLLGTAGALKKAEALLDEDFCVLNGDSYLPINPLDPIQLFRQEGFKAMMLTFRNKGQYGRSNASVQGGFVTLYSRVESRPEMEFIDYGLRMFRKEVLQLIPPDGFYDEDVLYQRLIAKNKLRAYPVSEPFYEIGTARGLARFEEYIKKAGLYQQ